jgi:SAM-dependent methyltransferase
MTTSPTAPAGTAEELAERLLTDAVATMETLSISLGVDLGLYRALADGPQDARNLAERAGIHPRYAREWLEQQAVAGILGVDHDAEDPYARTFVLPEPHRRVLIDVDDASYLGSLPGFMSSIAGVLTQVAEAFRSGGGVAYAAYGPGTRYGIAGMNRPMYRTMLSDWLAALPDVRQRLSAGPGAVLDLGCGTGASSLALAELFPQARVHGVDLDDTSVAEAAEAAAGQGLNGRVTFERADAAEFTARGPFDLVCVFEALHDMADPVAVLRAVRRALAPGGAVLVADERVAERFGAPGDLVERLNYAFSVLHCLPATRAEGTAVEAGTVLRPDTVRQYAEQAGLTCTVLPVENDLWRFYRLDLA